MKKRILLIFALGVSFTPIVFAGNTVTGQHDRPSEFNAGSVACEKDSNKPMSPASGSSGLAPREKSGPAGSTRGA